MEDEIVEVTITRRKPDGVVIRERLTGKDAKKWEKYCSIVGHCAVIHNMNPPWEELHWEEITISEWS